MALANRWSVIVVAGVLALSVAGSTAYADPGSNQNQKNEDRNLGIGAGAAALYGLTHGNPLVTILGAAGAAYAGKKYEDTRREQSQQSGNQPLYHRSGAAGDGSARQTIQATGYASTQRSNPIGVTVDGRMISFNGAQPMEENGSVMLPLRSVFEKLGADVTYNSSTATVVAVKGDRTVTMPIGSRTATIDGEPQELSQPAQMINGATMVPLRFVAEAFGDSVDWIASTRMVVIQSAVADRAAPAPVQSLPMASSAVSGVVRQVVADASPNEIVVRVDGDDRAIPVSNHVIVLRGRQGFESAQVSLSDIQPGDHVLVRQNDDGNAVSISSTFGLLHGSVNTVGTLANGDKVIVLNSGQTVELSPSARLLRNGESITPSNLTQGELVAISTDPTDDIGYRVNVEPPIEAHRR